MTADDEAFRSRTRSNGGGSEPSVHQLRLFLIVAEELHFGRAASRLFMAQPAFSKQIGVLERRLGIRLVERTSRAVELTPSGQALLPQARAVTEAMADLCHVAEVQSRENSGRIVVGTLAAEPAMPHTMVRGERRPLQRARSLDLFALRSTCRWGRYGRFDGHRVVTGARPTCVAASPPPALPSLLLEWSAVCTHAFPTPAYARSARPAPAGAGCRGFDGKLANRGAERRGPGGESLPPTPPVRSVQSVVRNGRMVVGPWQRS
ncbi:LysR family transcriptional regulator [Streptomyces tubercidicus]|uniref:LysR family transcriptional regulator n=1 Tax=Streptomyces tubercidicus TaxID=47759 RepID=UPI002E1205AF